MTTKAGEPTDPPGSGAVPLDGIRVVDLTQVIAGPYCTLMLADLGATVLKIERPGGGDDLRTIGRYPGRETHQDYFNAINRSKRSMVLDLKQAGGRAVFHRLAARADVVVENFAPGTAEKLGVDWPTLKAISPRLVYCSISGFGQSGPYRSRPALDPIIQAVAGLMSVTGDPFGKPMQAGAPLADVLAGMFAACAIVACLRSVGRHGGGRYIDVSMQDAMLAALGPRMGEALQAGLQPERLGNQNPMRVPADTYETADGRHLTIICQNERVWAPICRALGREEWLQDPRFRSPELRVEHREPLNAEMIALLKTQPASHWMQRLETERVPHALVNTYLEAVADPQIAHRGTIKTLQHPISGDIAVVGPPWIISGPQPPMFAPPLLGEHTMEVLREWLDEPEA